MEVSLHPHHVHFTCSEAVLQLGASFEVLTAPAPAITIDPEHKCGDLSALWLLVGKVVEVVTWEETINIVLTDNAVISIRPSEGRFRGTIIGRRDMTVED